MHFDTLYDYVRPKNDSRLFAHRSFLIFSPQTSVSEYPIIPSSQSCDSAPLTQHRSSSYSASVPPRHHSQSGSFVNRSNRFQRGAIATTSTEPFFGGSGSGVASFFRPIHLPRRPISYESLPHPLTQPYQHYKLPFVCPYGIQNFFQSPCPRATTLKQVPASPNLDLVISNVVAVCSGEYAPMRSLLVEQSELTV